MCQADTQTSWNRIMEGEQEQKFGWQGSLPGSEIKHILLEKVVVKLRCIRLFTGDRWQNKHLNLFHLWNLWKIPHHSLIPGNESCMYDEAGGPGVWITKMHSRSFQGQKKNGKERGQIEVFLERSSKRFLEMCSCFSFLAGRIRFLWVAIQGGIEKEGEGKGTDGVKCMSLHWVCRLDGYINHTMASFAMFSMCPWCQNRPNFDTVGLNPLPTSAPSILRIYNYLMARVA